MMDFAGLHPADGVYMRYPSVLVIVRVQEPCESRGGRPGLSVLTSLMVSVDVKQH